MENKTKEEILKMSKEELLEHKVKLEIKNSDCLHNSDCSACSNCHPEFRK